jgi:hypothetical protein
LLTALNARVAQLPIFNNGWPGSVSALDKHEGHSILAERLFLAKKTTKQAVGVMSWVGGFFGKYALPVGDLSGLADDCP